MPYQLHCCPPLTEDTELDEAELDETTLDTAELELLDTTEELLDDELDAEP